MDTHSPSPLPTPDVPDPQESFLKRTLRRMREGLPHPGAGDERPRVPTRRLLLLVVALIALYAGWSFLKGSFRSVEPGHVGIAVSRLTGSLEALPPGSYFRPPALSEIHPVRVSDQLLSGPEGTFAVSTREGVVVQMSVQARWAIDRRHLVGSWAALPSDPEKELVAPVLAASFRAVAPRFDVGKLVADGREEIAELAARNARSRLAESGIVLKEVLVSNLVLPAEYERGRVALVDEVQNTDRLAVTLRLKEKEIEKARLEGEARKATVTTAAEAAASQRLIAAKAESEAMKYILALKEKEIQQKKLEAEGERQSRVERAKAEAEVTRIQADAEVSRRKLIADAEAYSIRATSLAQFEGLSREAELVSANPLLIPKTFADRLSDKVQVILTPTIGGEAFTGEVFKRVANGKPPVEPPIAVRAAEKAASR
jgi:regulator of protease activity HflC (stomatin/prohibitin superfamily)